MCNPFTTRSQMAPLVAVFVALAGGGCEARRDVPRDVPRATTPAATAPAANDRKAPALTPEVPSERQNVPVVVAMGDIHGDLRAAKSALRLAGAIDDTDRWIGGSLVVVQIGDQIDRADDDRAVLDLFDRLSLEAAAAGGAVYSLLGNHEIMVTRGDTRYVTPGAFASFAAFAPSVVDETARDGASLATLPESKRGHRAAFRPGGPYAKKLARRALAIKIDRTLFVHGGLLAVHAELGLPQLNTDVRAWLQGRGPIPPWFQAHPETRPSWMRMFSMQTEAEECALLQEMLTAFDADRLVVAHTVQPGGITSACDAKVWRTDTGMSRYYGGPIQVLEIRGARVRVRRQ